MDGFGLLLKNGKIHSYIDCLFRFNRKATRGYELAAPTDRAGVRITALGWPRFIIETISKMSAFINSQPSVADARVSKFIAAVMQQKYEKIGAVGYSTAGPQS